MEFNAEEIFRNLGEQINLAADFKTKFDEFWKKEVGKRNSAQICYFLRHHALPASFEGFLYLFCSREMWESGGLGALSAAENLTGPVYLLNHGDSLEKVVALCREHGTSFIKILELFKTETELTALENEIKNIKAVVASAYENFYALYPNPA